MCVRIVTGVVAAQTRGQAAPVVGGHGGVQQRRAVLRHVQKSQRLAAARAEHHGQG